VNGHYQALHLKIEFKAKTVADHNFIKWFCQIMFFFKKKSKKL